MDPETIATPELCDKSIKVYKIKVEACGRCHSRCAVSFSTRTCRTAWSQLLAHGLLLKKPTLQKSNSDSSRGVSEQALFRVAFPCASAFRPRPMNYESRRAVLYEYCSLHFLEFVTSRSFIDVAKTELGSASSQMARTCQGGVPLECSRDALCRAVAVRWTLCVFVRFFFSKLISQCLRISSLSLVYMFLPVASVCLVSFVSYISMFQYFL